MRPSLFNWQTDAAIVGNLPGQKKRSAILLTINEKGLTNRGPGKRLRCLENSLFSPGYAILSQK